MFLLVDWGLEPSHSGSEYGLQIMVFLGLGLFNIVNITKRDDGRMNPQPINSCFIFFFEVPDSGSLITKNKRGKSLPNQTGLNVPS